MFVPPRPGRSTARPFRRPTRLIGRAALASTLGLAGALAAPAALAACAAAPE
jgi:hypothetical protein